MFQYQVDEELLGSKYYQHGLLPLGILDPFFQGMGTITVGELKGKTVTCLKCRRKLMVLEWFRLFEVYDETCCGLCNFIDKYVPERK